MVPSTADMIFYFVMRLFIFGLGLFFFLGAIFNWKAVIEPSPHSSLAGEEGAMDNLILKLAGRRGYRFVQGAAGLALMLGMMFL